MQALASSARPTLERHRPISGKRRLTNVTAAIITYNEAENLAELLPLLDWAAEVVVVDSDSTDRTAEVACEHGARVIERPFDTFALPRNFAIEQVTTDWVLSIDADERPTPRLLDSIERAVRRKRELSGQSDQCPVAYHVPIRSHIFGCPIRRSGTQDDRPIRLFRRDRARWTGEVHEVLGVDGPTGRLDGWLTHRTQHDLHTFLTKMNRYTTLDARARVEAGIRPRPLARAWRPVREVARRLIYKLGILDGPTGWAFCFLSGFYEYVLADKHRRYWKERNL
ncbi:MAG: glycosyltransferase family 2 protein [Planctomycetia bacterium]|jgi:hypothetical protein